MGKALNVAAIALDSEGRVVLSDDELLQLEKDARIELAGGSNGNCHNTSCVNPVSCGGSLNDFGCINDSACGGSFNGNSCTGHVERNHPACG